MNNYTPLEILIYASRCDDRLNFEMKDNVIKLGKRSWDCSADPIREVGLNFILRLISDACNE
jgi:hypothetical protein